MTSKLTITRERLQEIAEDGFLKHGESKILARMALAAMDSEPVAYMWDSKRNDIDAPGFYFPEHLFFAESNVKQWGGEVIPLYRHMQADPDGEQLAIENFRSAMEGIGHIRRTLEETFGGLHGTHVEPDVLAECKAICDAIYAAYRHAQPAPVVPEEKPMPNPLSMYAVDAVAAIAEAKGWNACRAAMLNGGKS